MYILFHADEHDRWLSGSYDAPAMQERCFSDDLIETKRTSDPWVKRRAALLTTGTVTFR